MRIFHRCLRSPHPEVLLLVGRERQKPGASASDPQRKGRHHGFVTATTYFACGGRRGYTQRDHRYARPPRYSVTAETEGLKALRTFSEEPDRVDLALLDHGMADTFKNAGDKRKKRAQKTCRRCSSSNVCSLKR